MRRIEMRRGGLIILAAVWWMAATAPVISAAADAAVSVSAASAILFEPTTGAVLFEKDAYTPRAMASTTKLMTALLAADAADWNREIHVTAEMVAVEGSALGLRDGDCLTLRDAVSGMLLSSGNDAANAVAISLAGSIPAFADEMNRKAASIGMTDSHFVTPSGLDGEGHAASAYDMALLGAAVLQDPVLAEICALSTDTIHINDRAVTVSNHNRLLHLYADAIGMKTGFTKKAGRCLVSAARRDGVTLIAVTLHAADDWNDHIAMLDYGFSQVRAVELPQPVLEPLPVTGGIQSHTALTVEAVESLVLPVGQSGTVRMTVNMPPFVFSPVQCGDVVGEVVYTLDGEVLMSLPITAGESVACRPAARTGGHFRETLRLLWTGLVG